MKTQILAIYLPQFYQNSYNDEWWGTGYTEWTACKKAKPLFEGHSQPRIPYDYYDLSNIDCINKQAEMARSNGIDGFAIYHYYSLGSKLLEVPTELLLKHKEVDINFCLYWANESWESRWYGHEKKVLWEQKYGNENDWEQHFKYCLEFFKDERYLKVNNMPIFIIYKDWLFKDIDKFIDYWNSLAQNNGFAGIYFVKTVSSRNNNKLEKFNATFEREPFYTFNKSISVGGRINRYIRSRCYEYLNKKWLIKAGKGVIQYKVDYKKCLDIIKKRKPANGEKTILGAFTDWDNSPRRSYNSTVFTGVKTELFYDCFKAQMLKAQKYNIPYVIINAWNEWGEGNYLEPDNIYGDGFLSAVKDVKNELK